MKVIYEPKGTEKGMINILIGISALFMFTGIVFRTLYIGIIGYLILLFCVYLHTKLKINVVNGEEE